MCGLLVLRPEVNLTILIHTINSKIKLIQLKTNTHIQIYTGTVYTVQCTVYMYIKKQIVPKHHMLK